MNRFSKLLEKFGEKPFLSSKQEKPKLLIIDDNIHIQNALKRILKQKKYDVIIRSTGKEGIASLTDDICVVILDIKLPIMEGSDVYSMLKKKNPAVPIIFYSAYPGEAQIACECMALKPYAFIQKGVEEEIYLLYHSIETAVNNFKTIEK